MTKYNGKKILKGYSDEVVAEIKEFKEQEEFPVSGLLWLRGNSEISDDYDCLLDFIDTLNLKGEIKFMKDFAKYFEGTAIFEQDINDN